MKIGTFEAKNKLSSLLERVEQGEVIYITRRGKTVAELRPVQESVAQGPQFGSAQDLVIEVPDDFTAPLDDFEDYMKS